MHVLILDAIHGGDILAERYIETGNEVTCADVYCKADEETSKRILSLGAKLVTKIPSEKYDLVVMPCHCPDVFLDGIDYDSRIFFSDAVNHFIKDDRFRIEITGVKGKTSTCYLLAHLLDISGKKVFLHTSRGRGIWKNGNHIIEEQKSIAPTSLLTLPPGDFDVLVCEVSLGGSGRADIACITNLLDNYGIAGNTRKAEEGKSAILCDKINIVPIEEIPIWSTYEKNVEGIKNYITVIGDARLGKPLEVSVDYNGASNIVLDGSYLSLQYINAINAALEICNQMGINREDIIEGLESFKGVPGRGEILKQNGKIYLRERNPGISHLSIEKTLSCLKEMNALENSIIVIDPINKKVCDKMNMELIKNVISKYDVECIITTGTGIRPTIPENKSTVIEFIKEGFQ